MSVFDDVFQEVDEAAIEFDNKSKKIDLLTEYLMSDYKVTCEQANLDVMTEKITPDEASVIMQEAAEKMVDKMEKSAKAIKDNAKSYFTKTKESIKKLSGNDAYQSTIEKAKKVCEETPSVGKKKITFKDYSAETKVIADGLMKVEKLLAKGKSKKNFSEEDGESLKEIITEVNKGRQKANPKTEEMTLSTAIDALSKLSTVIIENAEKQKGKNESPDMTGWDPASAKRYVDAIGAKEKLVKELSAVNVRSAVSLKNSIKKGIKHNRGVKEADDEVKESVDYGYEFDEDPIEESSADDDFNVSDYLSQIVTEMTEDDDNPVTESTNTESENTEEEVTESFDNTEVYMNNLLDEILNGVTTESTGEVVESSEEDDDLDADALLAEAAREAGIDLDDDEDEVTEDSDDDISINAEDMLAEAAREAGIDLDEDDDVEIGFNAEAALMEAARDAGIDEESNDSLDSLLESFEDLF